MTPILAEIQNVGLAASGFVLVLFSIMMFALCVCLIIAPLMIWMHVKGMRAELRDLATQINFAVKQVGADVKQIRATMSTPALGVDCPGCGKKVQPNANGTGRCVACGQMFRVER
jgi:hypothetical protein